MEINTTSFFSFIGEWYNATSHLIIDPKVAMVRLIMEHLNGDQSYLRHQKPAETIFEMVTGPIFDCLQPTIEEIVVRPNCKVVLCPETSTVNENVLKPNTLHLAFPNQESVEDKISDMFGVYGEQIDTECSASSCSQSLTVRKYQKIIDPKCGLVVVVGRIWYDNEQKKRIKINDLLQVDGQFTTQLVNGEMATFKLSSAIEHIGGPDAGHYIIHLCHDDEIFTINDDKEILKGKKKRPTKVTHFYLQIM